jgi:hypothetical protein
MIATRMFWELRMVRKLTAPPLTSGTATTKKSIIRARKSHAQMRLAKRTKRCMGVRTPAGATVLDPRSVTQRFPNRRLRAKAPQFDSIRASLFAGNLVDEARDRRVLRIVFVDDGEARLDAARQAGHAGGVGRRKLHRHIAHVERLLRQNQADHPLIHQFDGQLGCVISDDLDMTAEARIDDRRAGALRAENVGAEHAGELRFAFEYRRGLLRRLIGIVEIIVRPQHFDIGEFLSHHLLEALFAAFDRADIGIRRIDINGAFPADRFGEPAGRDAAALGIIRTDIADREFHGAVDVISIAQIRVDGDDRDAGVDGGLQRADHLILVGWRGDNVVQIAAGDHRIEDRRLNVDAPGRGNLRDDLDAEVFCGRLNPDLHDLVEWIHDPRQESDLDFRGGVGGMRRQGQSQSSCDCK